MADMMKDAIQFTSTATEPCSLKLEFKVSKDGVDKTFNDTLKIAQKNAQIPGFRIGKAPLAIVEKRYTDYILDDVERQIKSAALDKMSADDQLDVVSFGELKAENRPARGAEYSFTLDVEVAPEFTVPDFSAMSVEVKEGETVEDHMKARLEHLRTLYADYLTVEGAAQAGDILKVSFESDYVLPEDASPALTRCVKSEESWIWLNEPEQFPGVVKALTGATAGGEYSFASVFPADWKEAALAGKTINYKMKVHEVQRKTPIGDDNELAKKVGAESAEKMMENIKASAEQEVEYAKQEQVKGKILEQLLEKIEQFPLPKAVTASIVEREFSRIAERTVRSEKDVEEFKAKKEEHLAEAKKSADAYMRKFFILRKIAKMENVTVSQEELDAQITGMSQYMGYKEDDVRKMLQRNGGTSDMQAEMLMSKTLEAVSKKVKLA